MKKLFFLIIFLILPLFLTPKVFAEEIKSFDVMVNSHKDGAMDFKEIINYDFGSLSRHGIFRYIPTFAKVGNLYRIYKFSNLKVFMDGSIVQYQNNSDATQLSLKIGDPNNTITGVHNYEIDYKVTNGIGSNYTDHDEVYWNSTGNGWDVNIDNASITFNTDFGLNPTKVLCFTGAYGSMASDCQISKNSTKTKQVLYSNEGLTAVASYPVNTFPKSILSTSPPQTLSEILNSWFFAHILQIWLFLNIVLPAILLYWYNKHKNKDRFGKPAVNFDIPKDGKVRIAPAEAGTIDNAKLDKNDVTATIFDLAIRKYIKLVGTKKVRKFAPDTTDIKIQKLKSSDGLSNFEKTLYDRLFAGGDEVEVTDLKSDFYLTYQTMESEVFDSLKKNGYYVRNPKYERGGLIFLATVCLFTGNIFLSIMLFYLSRKLIGRTAKGDEIDFRIDGLKLFLKSQLRNYDWQAEKFYVVEQMIPYAMALGFIDKFMEQLKIINPDYNPGWYSGYQGSFYANYALFFAGLSSNITIASPSSSGSGGGGFSGGGGGGGGGGSW